MLSRDMGSSCSAGTTSAGSTPQRRSTRALLINGFVRESSLIEHLRWLYSLMIHLVSDAARAAAALYFFQSHLFNAITIQFMPPQQQTSPQCGKAGD